MKIRNGFVSNSSSSSFIIAVPMCTSTLGELQDYIFEDKEVFRNPYVWNVDTDTHGWPVSTITAIVFRDISKQQPKTMEQLVAENCGGYTPEYEQADEDARKEAGVTEHTMYDMEREDHNRLYERSEELRTEYSQDKIQAFMTQNPECFFFVVEYSDSDGELWSAMEHGDLFENIPHIRISHH